MAEAQHTQKRRRNRKKRSTATNTVSNSCSNTSSATTTVKLRADAPVFVPAFGDETHNDPSSKLGSINNKSKAPPKLPRSNRRNKKRADPKPDPRRRRQGHHQRHAPSHSEESHKRKGRKSSQKRHSNHVQTESNKLPLEHSPTNDNDDPPPPPQSLLSLSTFPALRPSTFVTATASVPTTAWSQAPRISSHQQNESLDGDDYDRQQAPMEQQSWGQGLEQLTVLSSLSLQVKPTRLGDGAIQYKTKEGYSKNEDDERLKEGSRSYYESHDNDKAESLMYHRKDFALPTVTSLNRRKRIDMNKLRDRWWDVLAQRRRQAEFREELRRRLEPLRIEPVAIHNDTTRIESDTDTDRYDNRHHSLVADDDNLAPGLQHYQVQPSCDTSTSHPGDSLDDIMERNDEIALLRLFALKCGTESYSDLMESAIRVAVDTNKPRLLRIVLANINGIPAEETLFRRPLFAALQLGWEECISVFLSNQHRGENLLCYADDKGNNVLHSCVRGSGSGGLLKLLLKHVPGSNKGKQQQLAKLLLSKNGDSLTPFHEACRLHRQDMVEVFLATCSTSLLAKILSTTDADCQTPLLTAIASNASEIVLSLIMWRGNHIPASRKTTFSSAHNMQLSKDHLNSHATCPLVWAGKEGNLEIIDLLIQFGSQSGSSYRVTDALHHLLRSSASIEVKLEGSEMLVFATANPFEEGPDSDTALSIGVGVRSPEVVQSLVSNGNKMLHNRQLARRRDPVLRQQPESFFRTLESKEDFEMKKATTRAVLKSLLCGFQSQIPVYFAISDALYANGVTLDRIDLSRLQRAMSRADLDYETPVQTGLSLMAIYDFPVFPGSCGNKMLKLKDIEYDRAPLSFRSQLLLGMKWMKDEKYHCPWLSEKASTAAVPSPSRDDEVVLISDDGSQFIVHESIIAQKSPKLESAIRFQRMNMVGDPAHAMLEVEVPIASLYLQSMIQHIYHGSIFCWPSFATDELCRFLLELFLIAEEYLCHDLMTEIEMRLLSSDPRACFCWCCCQAVRIHPVDGAMAQCMYCVDGKSSLLTENTVFDVMGLAEFIETPQYTLQVTSASITSQKVLGPRVSWSGGSVTEAFAALKDAVKLKVLCDFGKIRSNVDDNMSSDEHGSEDDTKSRKLLLLQMCVNDLQTSSIMTTVGSTGMKSVPSVVT